MQAYEFLASVEVKEKTGLLQNVLHSGRVKFVYYVYAYVPNFTEEEKSELKENIMKKDVDGKYKQMVEDEIGLQDEEKEEVL